MATSDAAVPDDARARAALRRGVAAGAAILLVAFGAWYLIRHREALASEVTVRPAVLLPLLLVESVLLAIRGALLRALCRPFAARLGAFEATGLAAGSSLANYLAPGVGGGALRAGYLNRRHGLPYGDFLGVLTATYLVQYLVVASLGLVVLPAVVLSDLSSKKPLAIGLLIIVGSCVLLLYRPPRPSGATAIPRAARRIAGGCTRIRHAGVLPLLALVIAHTAATALSVHVAFRALGQSVGVPESLFLAVCSELSILVNLTPAGLGVVEGAVGLGAALLGLSPPVAVAAAATRRIANIVAAVLLGGSSLVRGLLRAR